MMALMTDITICAVTTADPLYGQAVALRNAVLRHPLGLVLTPEELALDAEREHIVAVIDGAVVGSVSLYLETPPQLRVKQMAVDPLRQGLGIGAKLMQAAETRGRELGAHTVMLHARCTALPFYAKQDYRVEGNEFVEMGIPHRIMVKRMVKSLA